MCSRLSASTGVSPTSPCSMPTGVHLAISCRLWRAGYASTNTTPLGACSSSSPAITSSWCPVASTSAASPGMWSPSRTTRSSAGGLRAHWRPEVDRCRACCTASSRSSPTGSWLASWLVSTASPSSLTATTTTRRHLRMGRCGLSDEEDPLYDEGHGGYAGGDPLQGRDPCRLHQPTGCCLRICRSGSFESPSGGASTDTWREKHDQRKQRPRRNALLP